MVMKKIVASVMAVATLALAFAGCGKSPSDDGKGSGNGKAEIKSVTIMSAEENAENINCPPHWPIHLHNRVSRFFNFRGIVFKWESCK